MQEKEESILIQLVDVKKFKVEKEQRLIKRGFASVEPYGASICHADLRYYSGNRRKEALLTKLPMALFHEGIGIVKKDSTNTYSKGTRVIIIPNTPHYEWEQKEKEQCCEVCRETDLNNYCEKGHFLGSGFDGIAQTNITLPINNYIAIPDYMTDDIAILAELCTVSIQGIQRLPLKDINTEQIAIFGDGPVGYLTAVMLHTIFDVPIERLTIFGANEKRLKKFHFARTYHVAEVDFCKLPKYPIVIECTGGKFSSSAINQSIQVARRLGHLLLLGVSEELVPVNTRDLLEKGLTVYGSSRSTRKDFEMFVGYSEYTKLSKLLEPLVPDVWTKIKSIEDLNQAMDDTLNNPTWKKTYLQFEWQEVTD